MNGGGKSFFDTIKHPGTNVPGCFLRSVKAERILRVGATLAVVPDPTMHGGVGGRKPTALRWQQYHAPTDGR